MFAHISTQGKPKARRGWDKVGLLCLSPYATIGNVALVTIGNVAPPGHREYPASAPAGRGHSCRVAGLQGDSALASYRASRFSRRARFFTSSHRDLSYLVYRDYRVYRVCRELNNPRSEKFKTRGADVTPIIIDPGKGTPLWGILSIGSSAWLPWLLRLSLNSGPEKSGA